MVKKFQKERRELKMAVPRKRRVFDVLTLIWFSFLVFSFCCLFSPTIDGAEKGQKWPERELYLLVAYEAGSAADILVRPLADGFSRKLGVPVVVINKPGAAGSIGARELWASKPDGYTLGAYNGAVINYLQGLHPFTHRDFDTIGVYNTSSTLIVAGEKTPWRSAQELIEHAKLHPREIKAATSSVGGYFWLAAMLFQQATGTSLTIIPQKGAGAEITRMVVGGHVDIGFEDLPAAAGQIEAGNLRVLAVLGPRRLGGKFASVPTLAELGYEVDVRVLRPILAPKGLDRSVYEKLVKAVGEAATDPKYMEFAREQGTEPFWAPGEEGVRLFDDQEKAFRPVLERAGLLKLAQ